MRLFGIAVLLVGVFGEGVINSKTEIEIPKDKQESHEGKKQFYRIIVKPNSPQFKCPSYIIAKRFSEFAKLYDELYQNSPSHKLFENDIFPPKSWFGTLTTLSPEEVEERRRSLEDWLKAALEMLVDKDSIQEASEADLLNMQSLTFFLDPDSGEAACLSGIMIPADQFRYCGKTHFFGIHVQNNAEGNGYYVFRRYNQFHDLANEFGERSWELPGKKVFPWPTVYDQLGWDSLDVRRKNLESWLQELSKSPIWKPKLLKKSGFLDPRAAKRDFYSCIAALAAIEVTDLEFDDTIGCPPCPGKEELCPAGKEEKEEL